ncbi:hypothetical protein [Sunxiuqinia sp. sy24]|uniref:hypothetical protein n=1 Tax=Sunxiuqinia sp. sy24 TaxID=3461495 RepID=UPI004045CFF0
MKKKSAIVLIIIGIMMIAYTGFNYITKEKVVDIGPIEITKERNHVVQWPPVVGIVLIAGGMITIFMDKKIRT